MVYEVCLDGVPWDFNGCFTGKTIGTYANIYMYIFSITNEQIPCKLYIYSTWVKVFQIYSAVDPVSLNVPSCT